MRHSKWENKDSEDIYDRAPPRRPRESFSPGRDSRRHDNRSRENAMTLDRERFSPERDDWRVRHSNQSPRNGRGRSHRISRSRSRSQSPSRNFRREPEINDRNGRLLECGPPDDWDGRGRRTGSSRYSPYDIKDNTIRAKQSANICKDFLKGRCKRGDTCRFVHRDSSSDVFDKGPGEEHQYRDRSQEIYPDHDHRSRDTYRDHERRSRDTYRDHDHRRKDMYTDRNHESETHRSGETPTCKYFASGNCRNGSRCLFSHQVQEVFSPKRRSRDDNCETDSKFEGNRGWDGLRWDEVTTVLDIPKVPGWEDDKNENKEDGKGRDRKNEGDQIWDGPSWTGYTSVSYVPGVHGWANDNNETNEVVKDTWSHDMLVKLKWDQPVTVIDKTQIQEKENPLKLKSESNVLKGEDVFSGDMEISPRDINKESMFESDKNVNVDPIPEISPSSQNPTPVVLQAPQGKGIQEVSLGSSSLENKVAGGPHNNVNNEQLAQQSHLTASLTQLENSQQLPQLSSSISSHGMLNVPDLVTNLPPISQPPQVLQQYDQKNDTNEIYIESYDSNPQEKVKQSKEENGKDIAGLKAGENGPSQGVGPDDGAYDGKNVKDLKELRSFKFALVEFVKELLKPSWKDGQVSKEAYKTIVKKVVDKVMETLGSQIPQTKEKIDLYLSCSKPKIAKLVQAYVGKHQKG